MLHFLKIFYLINNRGEILEQQRVKSGINVIFNASCRHICFKNEVYR